MLAEDSYVAAKTVYEIHGFSKRARLCPARKGSNISNDNHSPQARGRFNFGVYVLFYHARPSHYLGA